MESVLEIKPKSNYSVILEKLKLFFESKWFIFLLGIITIITWWTKLMYTPYILLCIFIMGLAITKAKANSIIGLLMLYIAGNQNGELKTSGAGFITIIIFAVLAVGMILWRFIPNLKENTKKILTNKIIIALLFLIASMLISIINSPVKLHSLGLTGVFALNILVSIIVLLDVDNTEEARDIFALSMIVFMLVVSVEFEINILKEIDEPNHLWELLKSKRIDVGWALGNHFVVIINMGMVMCGYLFIKCQRLFKRLLITIAIVIGLLAEVLTLSRGGFLGLFTCTLCMIFVVFVFSKNKRTILTATGLVLVSVGITLAILFKTGVLDKIIDSLKFMGTSENGRKRIWDMAWALFKEHWLIGTGWGTSRYYLDTVLKDWVYNYHNYFWQISTCGIVGIASFLSYLIIILKSCVKKNLYCCCVITIIFMFLTHGFVDTLFFSKNLMLLLSILVMLTVSKRSLGVELNMRKSVKESLSIDYSINLFKNKPVFSFVKRSFDIISSFIGIIVLSWLFIVLGILVKLTSKGPIFYGHKRIGKNGKEFKVWKFRSMKTDNRPLEEILTPEQLEEYKRDFKVTNDPRVTKIGKFLRKTSLDELPQLWNIFVGQMSVVGWRPILEEELERYGDNKELLLKVRPGLTGYWASHGRSDTSYDNRIKMELYYCVKRSVWLDIRILWHTIFGVFVGKGAK